MEMHAPVPESTEFLATQVVDAALKVHKKFGPGLYESVYERCLVHELRKRGLEVKYQVLVPVIYDELQIDDAFRLDIIVNDDLIIEGKAVEEMKPIFKTQVLTYLRLTEKRLGLLINFNVELIKDGIHRIVN